MADVPPIALSDEQARAWSAAFGRGLSALRLNKQFPPAEPLAKTAAAIAQSGSVRIDPEMGLPAAREWVRARADRTLADETLARFADVDLRRLPAEEAQRVARKRAYLEALVAIEPPASRRMEVALRSRSGARASYRVIIDRLDIASGVIARYTIVLSDTPGARISEGELALAASREFAERLELLSTQDAALAFAVLRSQGLEVEEIVRGVVGPAVLPGRAGPLPLRALRSVAVSAAIERVSLDLREGVVDDPIPRPVTVPAAGVDFGLSVQRKWAAEQGDTETLRAWLQERGSRNLIYSYGS